MSGRVAAVAGAIAVGGIGYYMMGDWPSQNRFVFVGRHREGWGSRIRWGAEEGPRKVRVADRSSGRKTWLQPFASTWPRFGFFVVSFRVLLADCASVRVAARGNRQGAVHCEACQAPLPLGDATRAQPQVESQPVALRAYPCPLTRYLHAFVVCIGLPGARGGMFPLMGLEWMGAMAGRTEDAEQSKMSCCSSCCFLLTAIPRRAGSSSKSPAGAPMTAEQKKSAMLRSRLSGKCAYWRNLIYFHGGPDPTEGEKVLVILQHAPPPLLHFIHPFCL